MTTYLPPIISSIFNATDATADISHFINESLYTGQYTYNGTVTNWTEVCSYPGNPFHGVYLFVGCLLYPNVTRNILNGTLSVIQGNTNLTAVGFTSLDIASSIRSIYSTCLPTYCASDPGCAAANVCDVGNLLTSGYELSAQGVGNCYDTLCSGNVAVPNADLAGIGVCISRLLLDNRTDSC